jgi:hypothetical protein
MRQTLRLYWFLDNGRPVSKWQLMTKDGERQAVTEVAESTVSEPRQAA